MHTDPGTVTELLGDVVAGSTTARDRLWADVYEELRQVAHRLMRHAEAGHTLQATVLVHEAYGRLLGGARLNHPCRAYFFAAAAQAMRRVLVEHARKRKGRDRGNGLPLDALVAVMGQTLDHGVLELKDALEALREHDRRVYDVVTHRFHLGLSIDDTSELLELSPRTVKRSWTYGRAWLYDHINRHSDGTLS